VTAPRRGARDDLPIRLPEEPKGERIPIQSTPDTPDYVDPGPDGPLEKVPAELEPHSRDGDTPDHEHPAADEPLPDAERFDTSEGTADQVDADADSRQNQPLPDPPAHEPNLDPGFEPADGYSG
jgi:hypothetical protein